MGDAPLKTQSIEDFDKNVCHPIQQYCQNNPNTFSGHESFDHCHYNYLNSGTCDRNNCKELNLTTIDGSSNDTVVKCVPRERLPCSALNRTECTDNTILGSNPFCSYNFVITPRSQKEYFKKIGLALNKKLNYQKKKHKREILECFYVHYLNNNDFKNHENFSRKFDINRLMKSYLSNSKIFKKLKVEISKAININLN